MHVYEAKSPSSKLVARTQAGERVLIARNGRPVAEVGAEGGITIKREPGVLAAQCRKRGTLA